MAKRLTDTEKWKREWFYDLKPQAKLAWLYILDQCDHAGIWPRNFRLATEQLGFKFDHETMIEWFGEKVVFFAGDKYFVPSFFDFQYGSSKQDFKARQSAVAALRKFGLIDVNGDPLISLPKCPEQLANSQEQLPNCPSIGIGKGTGKEGGVGETKPPHRHPSLADDFTAPFLAKVKIEVQSAWLETYPDKAWVHAEIKRAVTWSLANAHKAPKSDWAKFFTSWLSRGWETHRRGLASTNQRQGPPPIRYPSADKVFAEQDAFRATDEHEVKNVTAAAHPSVKTLLDVMTKKVAR